MIFTKKIKGDQNWSFDAFHIFYSILLKIRVHLTTINFIFLKSLFHLILRPNWENPFNITPYISPKKWYYIYILFWSHPFLMYSMNDSNKLNDLRPLCLPWPTYFFSFVFSVIYKINLKLRPFTPFHTVSTSFFSNKYIFFNFFVHF